MKTIFLTMHVAGAPRKASLLLLADGFASIGWDVRIVTLSYSWLTIAKGDPRHSYAKTVKHDAWFDVGPNLKGYLARTLLSPSRLPTRWLNTLSKPFFRWYSGHLPRKVAAEIPDADIIVIESGPGHLLMPELQRLAPNARYVYLHTDRLATLRVNPVISDAEKRNIPLFDLISVPSAEMLTDFDHPNCVFVPQGVAKESFDAPVANPYSRDKNIVSVGDMLFHEEAVATLARENPDWTIHLFGGKALCRENFPNVVAHGETPFTAIIPYIKYADVGLAPYRPAPKVEYISQSSLKMKQYTYAKLPILTPAFAAGFYDNAIGYDPHNLESLKPALEKAAKMDRSSISTAEILSWSQIAEKTIGLFRQRLAPAIDNKTQATIGSP